MTGEAAPEGTPRAGALACRAFYDALLAEGFTPDQAIAVVASWYGRAPGMDMAAMNAVYANFADHFVESLKTSE